MWESLSKDDPYINKFNATIHLTQTQVCTLWVNKYPTFPTPMDIARCFIYFGLSYFPIAVAVVASTPCYIERERRRQRERMNMKSAMANMEALHESEKNGGRETIKGAEENGRREKINGGREDIKGEESNSSAEEQHRLSVMRAFVECRDPSSKEVDDLTLRRFLRARDLDVEKAAGLFLKYLKWRRTFVPKGYISETEVQNEIAQNKMFLGGVDKKQRPIVLVFGRRHFQNNNLDEFKRFVVYGLDKICSRMPAGQEKFLGIGDLHGWGYSNSDIRGYLGALSILQDCYSERLGKLFIVHAPRIFLAVWKIVYPFIDNKTKTKIVFVEDRKLKSTLLEDIDESQLPDIYGGKLPLVPIQDASC